jgi:putative ABC transport system permease protein
MSARGGSPLRKVARAGAYHRRLQSLVLILVTMGSVTAALLAVQLLVGTNAPFDQGFARQNGSELTVRFDTAQATSTVARIAATAHADGVTAAAGPYPQTQIGEYTASANSGVPAGVVLPPITLVGRTGPGGAVDDMTLTSGRWASAPDEIVLSTNTLGADTPTGITLTFPEAPGSPTLTVVGYADSVSQTADGWVLPAEIAKLRAPDASFQYQMLYRFTNASTTAQLASDQAAVTAAAPKGAVTDTESYLAVKAQSSSGGGAIIPPFLAVFGILGVGMSVIILAGAVGATIGTSSRRIGILKALGATPAQVIRTYCMQALIPCVIGIALGTVLGSLAASSLLQSTGEAFGTGTPPLTLWVELVVPATALALVATTALLTAARAGRLSVLDALATGRTPKANRGRRIQRALTRLPLPRPVSMGLAGPFTRPARTIALTMSIVFGVLAVTLAIGVSASLSRASADVAEGESGDVQVSVGSLEPSMPTAQQSNAVEAAIKAQPGTAAYYSSTYLQMPVSGVSGDTTVLEYSGDSSWSHYPLISGHWLTGPEQAVVPTAFLRATGDKVGDVLTLAAGAGGKGTENNDAENVENIPATIVGEVFDTHQSGMVVMTEAQTLGQAQPDIPDGAFIVKVKPGTDIAGYIQRLNTVIQPDQSSAMANQTGSGKLIITLDALSGLMTLMLVAVAGLGVLGAVVLDTRERVHDLGVYKAIGMTPRQATGMVLTSVTWLGLIAGLIGVPAGIAVHNVVLPLMGDTVGATLPTNVITVYHAAELALLAVGGIVIALLGALGPAGWAGRIRTATALRTE